MSGGAVPWEREDYRDVATVDAEDIRAGRPAAPAARAFPDPPSSAAFYGLFGDLVDAIDPHTESDRTALLIQALVVFGSLIGRTAHFMAESTPHYCNLFAVLVGVSSKGRKGSSYAHIGGLAKALDASWQPVSGLSSGEGLIWHVRDAIHGERPLRGAGRLGDETERFLEDRGVEDKRLCVVEPEFSRLLRIADREGSTLSAVIREAWDSGRLSNLTKNSRAVATDAHVSIIGHITTDELRRSLTATDSANGFANRFLWVCAQRSKLLPDGGAFTLTDNMLECWRDALAHARNIGVITRNEAARELWHARYEDLSAGRPGLLGSITGRAEAQTMRLACLYALADCAATVERPHLEAALALWDYCFRSARFIFGDSLGDPVADELLRALRTERRAGLSRTDIISQVFRRNVSAMQITRAIDLLLEHGLVRAQIDRSGPRLIERWFAMVTNDESSS